jgi:Cupin-like domain
MLVISIFIFCIVLFLYLHIHFHLKRSNDLEVYEIEQPSKQRLEEVCDIRQPTTFEFYNEQILTQLSYQAIHTNYRAFDIHMRDVSKTPKSHKNDDITKIQQKGTEHEQVLYIPVTLKIAHEVLKKDTDMKYISEHNADFIDETGLIKIFQLNDEFLRPYMVSTCMYDILMASTNTTTPLRYEVNYRNYFLVTQGRIKMLLIPPKDTRYLYPINDYDILEFRTPVNPWKVQPEYQDDFDKIKTLEVELFQGMVMFVPAYWWYSIQFIVSETSVCSFKYRTHMNTISIAPQLILNVLQNMNIKRDTLENRAYIKNQFQNSTITSNTNSENGNALQQNASSSSSSSSSSSHYQSGTEYVPSLEDQYLPKTLRGTSSNPYSIMNAMSENVATTESNPPLTIEPSSSSPLEVSTVPETIKEVIVTPNLVSSQESSSVIS